MITHSLYVSMLILPQHDLEAAVAFYEKIGFSLQFHVEDQWAEFLCGTIKIGLAVTRIAQEDRRTGIVLGTPDLLKTFAFLSEHGVRWVNQPKKAASGWIASFADPGNNVIDLYESHESHLEVDGVKNTNDATIKNNERCAAGKPCCKTAKLVRDPIGLA